MTFIQPLKTFPLSRWAYHRTSVTQIKFVYVPTYQYFIERAKRALLVNLGELALYVSLRIVIEPFIRSA